MAWDSPTGSDANATYNFVFQHTNGEVITIVSQSASVDPANADAAFAQAAALLNANDDFTVLACSKTYPVNQTYTL